VRAIELDGGRAQELARRLRAFAGVPPAGVDVQVLPNAFQDRTRDIQIENASVPIVLAHRYTAISLVPGGKVLDILSRQRLGASASR
jgi:hypothetical protein